MGQDSGCRLAGSSGSGPLTRWWWRCRWGYSHLKAPLGPEDPLPSLSRGLWQSSVPSRLGPPQAACVSPEVAVGGPSDREHQGRTQSFCPHFRSDMPSLLLYLNYRWVQARGKGEGSQDSRSTGGGARWGRPPQRPLATGRITMRKTRKLDLSCQRGFLHIFQRIMQFLFCLSSVKKVKSS